MDLDSVVMGAIMAKPALLNSVFGFADQEMERVFQDLKSGKRTELSHWLKAQGVRVFGDEMFVAVLLAHEKQVIEKRLKDVSRKAHSASCLHLTKRIEELNTAMKGLLEKHEANASKEKDASQKYREATQKKSVETKAGTENRTQANATQKEVSKEETKREPVRTGSVPGEKPGLRVSGTAGPAKRPLQPTGPAPHRTHQVGQK